jgi:hypothetical protein
MRRDSANAIFGNVFSNYQESMGGTIKYWGPMERTPMASIGATRYGMIRQAHY